MDKGGRPISSRTEYAIIILCLLSCAVAGYFVVNVIDKYALPYAQFGFEKAWSEGITFVERNIRMNVFSNGEMTDANGLVIYHFGKNMVAVLLCCVLLGVEFHAIRKWTGIDMFPGTK